MRERNADTIIEQGLGILGKDTKYVFRKSQLDYLPVFPSLSPVQNDMFKKAVQNYQRKFTYSFVYSERRGTVRKLRICNYFMNFCLQVRYSILDVFRLQVKSEKSATRVVEMRISDQEYPFSLMETKRNHRRRLRQRYCSCQETEGLDRHWHRSSRTVGVSYP